MKINGLAFGLVGVSAATLGSSFVIAADWPQWRGPQRDGISQETGLLQEWPKDGPKLLWQIKDAGSGYSTPAVVGDRLYMLGNKGTDDEFVEARSTKDGSRIWSVTIGKVGNPDQHPSYPGARSTPTIDGNMLYALGSDGDLVCLDTASGKVRWKKNLRTDFDGKPGVWAYAESPLVDGNKLALHARRRRCDDCRARQTHRRRDLEMRGPGRRRGRLRVDRRQRRRRREAICAVSGKRRGRRRCKSGKFLWRYEKTAKGSPANIPTPLADSNFVYSAAGKSGGGLVKIQSDDGVLKAEQEYFSPKLPTAIGGVVKVGDYMYGTNSQALLCVKFTTGDIVWSERGIGAASILYADGRLYLHGENGEVALVEASPEAYKERGPVHAARRARSRSRRKPGPIR